MEGNQINYKECVQMMDFDNGFCGRWITIQKFWSIHFPWLWLAPGLGIGFTFGVFTAHFYASGNDDSLLHALGPEVVGIFITVSVIDQIYRWVEVNRLKDDLKRKVGGRDNSAAIDAVFQMRRQKWLYGPDSVLAHAILSYAKLENAQLWRANLMFADLRRADLRNAKLQGADLRCANLTFATCENTYYGDFRIPISMLTDEEKCWLKQENRFEIQKFRIPRHYLTDEDISNFSNIHLDSGFERHCEYFILGTVLLPTRYNKTVLVDGAIAREDEHLNGSFVRETKWSTILCHPDTKFWDASFGDWVAISEHLEVRQDGANDHDEYSDSVINF